MKKTSPSCPVCNSNAHVHKVSEIYISGLESIKADHPLKNNLFDSIFGQISQKFGKHFVEFATKRTLVSKFAPPSGGKQRITRSIPPDFIMAVTFIFSAILLYNVFTQQNSFFVPVLLTCLAFASFYLLFRKKINTRYLQKQFTENHEKEVVEHAIDDWMKLYYCSIDYCVFDQKRRIAVPLEDANRYLLSPQSFQNPPDSHT